MSPAPAVKSEREDEITLLEVLLGVRFPPSYRGFVSRHGSGIVRGLPILGLPVSLDLISVWGATEYFRSRRPDLGHGLIAIRIIEDRALCLDVRDGPRDEAEMVEVLLAHDQKERPAGTSFPEYLRLANEEGNRVSGKLDRIRQHLSLQKHPYSHTSGQRRPPFIAQHWRVLRSCVHDRVVGLVAMRHDRKLSALDVDVFICTDHPDYELGHGCCGLLVLMLSDAYRNGASMSINFTRGSLHGGRRDPVRIPREILRVVQPLGIHLTGINEGRIHHHEAIEIFARLVGICSEHREVIRRFENKGVFTLPGYAYLIGSRIWTQSQAQWLLHNADRPADILFGTDSPENRPAFEESLIFGRVVLAVERLSRRLRPQGDAANWEESDTTMTPAGLLWQVTCAHEMVLEWAVAEGPLQMQSGESIQVLASPRKPLPWEPSCVLEDAMELDSRAAVGQRKFLLYSNDIRSVKTLGKLASKVGKEHGVSILVMPASIQDLDPEVLNRMAKARNLRR